MAFFDEMKGKFSQASQSTVQKAKDMSEIAKLNSAISEAENHINEFYGKIGFEVYRTYRNHPLPEVAGMMEQVTALHQKIEDCRSQIKAINSANSCPQCGAKISKGMSFCSGCGYKLEVLEQPVVNEPTAFCNNCGATLSAGALFCTSCGKKIN